MKTICVKCGKEFNVPPGTIKHGNGKFCSINCYRIEQRGGIETMRKCLRCEKAYNVSPSRIKTGRGKYCSRSCQNKAAFKKCVCRFCGKKYLNYISQGGDKYCSLICYKKSKPAFMGD